MKIRTGFVSNSSSSSFIIIHPDKGPDINHCDAEPPFQVEVWGHYLAHSTLIKKIGQKVFDTVLYSRGKDGLHTIFCENDGGYGFGLDKDEYSREQAQAKLAELLGVDLGLPVHITLGEIYT